MPARLVPLRKVSNTVKEVATTISLAFSEDPLIRWLRPHGRPWGELDASSMKWQSRRVREAISRNFMWVLTSDNVMTEEVQKSYGVSTTIALQSESEASDFEAVAILEPPKNQQKLGWRDVIPRIQLWLLNTFSPAEDQGGDSERVGIMLEAHDNSMSMICAQLHPQQPWYLEVAAVRPASHGQGFGGELMRQVIQLAAGAPIVLECTNTANIGFYTRFGFEKMETIHLQDKQGAEDFWYCLMLRR